MMAPEAFAPVPNAWGQQGWTDGPGTAAAACARGDRVLVVSDGAWYAARIKAQPGKDGLCPVHYDGCGDNEDEAVPLKRVRVLH